MAAVAVLVEVKIGVPVQVALSGPNRLKVTVPVGLVPPARVAVSLMVPPTTTAGDAVVVRVTSVGAAMTATDSLGSRHGVGPLTKLLTSPLYVARNL